MRRKAVLGWAACLAAVIPIGLGLSLYWVTHEPLCQGKPVRLWVEEIATAPYGPRELAEEQLQSAADVAVPAILEALQADGKSLRDRINDSWLKVWSRLPKPIQKIVPAPRPAFRPDRRMWISALPKLGPHDKRVVREIRRALLSKDSEVRFFATMALGELATKWTDQPVAQQEIIQSLEQMLKDPAYNVRGGAAYGLAKCGPAAGGSISALIAMLSDPQEHARISALRAISYIGGDSNVVVPAVAPLVQSTQYLTRAFAAYTICRTTGRTEPGLPVLIGLLSAEEKDWDDSPRSVAAGFIGRLGTNAQSALPELERAAETSESTGRMAAAMAIWRITGSASNSVQVLRSILRTGGRAERIAVTGNLAEIGPQAAAALPELVAALDNQDFLIRRNAVQAVGNIGQFAAVALPKLQMLLNDPFPSIQKSAAEAIRQVSDK